MTHMRNYDFYVELGRLKTKTTAQFDDMQTSKNIFIFVLNINHIPIYIVHCYGKIVKNSRSVLLTIDVYMLNCCIYMMCYVAERALGINTYDTKLLSHVEIFFPPFLIFLLKKFHFFVIVLPPNK